MRGQSSNPNILYQKVRSNSRQKSEEEKYSNLSKEKQEALSNLHYHKFAVEVLDKIEVGLLDNSGGPAVQYSDLISYFENENDDIKNKLEAGLLFYLEEAGIQVEKINMNNSFTKSLFLRRVIDPWQKEAKINLENAKKKYYRS